MACIQTLLTVNKCTRITSLLFSVYNNIKIRLGLYYLKSKDIILLNLVCYVNRDGETRAIVRLNCIQYVRRLTQLHILL